MSRNALNTNFEGHDYVAYTPGVDSMKRGVENLVHVDPSDRLNAEKFANEVNGLVNGELEGFTRMYQSDARSGAGEDVRDASVHAIGLATGFDVDGALTASEQEGGIQISVADLDALGIDNSGEDMIISGTLRHVQFGSVALQQDWQVTEIEFRNNLLQPDGSVIERYNRILNFVPL